jgi:hypothetical protein
LSINPPETIGLPAGSVIQASAPYPISFSDNYSIYATSSNYQYGAAWTPSVGMDRVAELYLTPLDHPAPGWTATAVWIISIGH